MMITELNISDKGSSRPSHPKDRFHVGLSYLPFGCEAARMGRTDMKAVFY